MSHQIKKGIKVIGIACSSFVRNKEKDVLTIGVIYRGAILLEGIILTRIMIDGDDATEKIAEMILTSAHLKQLKVIMTRGVTIAGFNYIDLRELYEKTTLPIISIVDRQPDMAKIASALRNLPNGSFRLSIIEKNGLPKPIQSSKGEKPIFIQSIGFFDEELTQIIRNTTLIGRIPEPIRVAKLIATSLSR